MPKRPPLPPHSARCRELRKEIAKYVHVTPYEAYRAGGFDKECPGCQVRAVRGGFKAGSVPKVANTETIH